MGNGPAPLHSGGLCLRSGLFLFRGFGLVTNVLATSRRTLKSYEIPWHWEKGSLCWIKEGGEFISTSDITKENGLGVGVLWGQKTREAAAIGSVGWSNRLEVLDTRVPIVSPGWELRRADADLHLSRLGRGRAGVLETWANGAEIQGEGKQHVHSGL